MTDALDRAAEAAHDTWMHSTRDIYGRRSLWRDITAAALRVMADDIRAVHQMHYDQCCVCGHVWPCETVRIIDSYVGSES